MTGVVRICDYRLFGKASRIGVISVILSASEELQLDVQKFLHPGKSIFQRGRVGHTGSNNFRLAIRRSETLPVRHHPRSSSGKRLLVKGEKELRKMQADPGGWRWRAQVWTHSASSYLHDTSCPLCATLYHRLIPRHSFFPSQVSFLRSLPKVFAY